MPRLSLFSCLFLACLAPLANADRIYIGTYTRGASEGIYTATFDPETGKLGEATLAAKTENPSFLAVDPARPVLYAVGEAADGGTISAFGIEEDTGSLTFLNQQSTVGSGPCHVNVAPGGRHVAVANYGGGSTTLLPLDDAGKLLPASAHIQHEGSSVHPRQKAPHAHSVNFDPAGRFLFTADLGLDRVLVYRYDSADGSLTPHDPPAAWLAPGAGPRHFAFHPKGAFAYSVNELDSTVTAFSYDAKRGVLTTNQTVRTLPEDFTGENTTAEIRVHPSGRFVYASNRGQDSIAVFEADEGTGQLTPTGHISTGGKTPRNFNVDPTGRWLIAANQNSGSVHIFAIDPEIGALQPTGEALEVESPVCILFWMGKAGR